MPEYEDKVNQWDWRVSDKTGWCHFLQSAEWAKIYDQNNWRSRLTELRISSKLYPVALLRRSAPLLGFVYQIPKIARLTPDTVGDFTNELKTQSHRGLVLKIDIDQPFDEKLHQELLKHSWRRVPSIQYRETVLIDLTQPREELLKSFKKRARTELNAGLRRGVRVEKVAVTPDNMELVYGLLQETYKRAGFITRKRSFTEEYWREFARSGHGSMYVAKLDGQPLAAAYIIHIGERAFYKDGASIRQRLRAAVLELKRGAS